MVGFAEFRPDIISTHKSKTPWCILNSDCGLGLTKLQIKKMCKMAILGQKWSFLAFLRGLHGVTGCLKKWGDVLHLISQLPE